MDSSRNRHTCAVPLAVVERDNLDARGQAGLNLSDTSLDGVDDGLGVHAGRATTTPPTASFAPLTSDATRKALPICTLAIC